MLRKQRPTQNEASLFDCATRRNNITQEEMKKWSFKQEFIKVISKFYLHDVECEFSVNRERSFNGLFFELGS